MGEYGANHHRAISVDLEWTESNLTEELEMVGLEQALKHEVELVVKEELRLPNDGVDSKKLSGQEDLHPFWLIKRQSEGPEINCDFLKQGMNVSTQYEFDEVKGSGCHSVFVWYPFISNNNYLLIHFKTIINIF